MPRPLTPHTRKILALLHCTEAEAHMVESLMRDEGYLGDMRNFDKRARNAKRIIDRDEEPRATLTENLCL